MTIASSPPPLPSPLQLATKSDSTSSSTNSHVNPSVAAADVAVSCDVNVDFLPTSLPIHQILTSAIDRNNDELFYPALYAVDLSKVARQLHDFRAALPGVTPYYALKCNPDPVLIAFLARLGVSFDCASRYEIDLVKSAMCDAGHANEFKSRMIFANPFKMIPDLKYVRTLGAGLMTFDCVDELEKIAYYYPEAELLLRLAVDDSKALCPLSSKFGAHMNEVDEILDYVLELGLNLIGLAFHVGSGCTTRASYEEALKQCRVVCDMASDRGIVLNTIDVGGGFPGHDNEAPVTFKQIADTIRTMITRMFSEDMRVIAEPGRYCVASAYTLATEVVLSRRRKDRSCHFLADGVFGSFKDAHILKVRYPAKFLRRNPETEAHDSDGEEICNLYGPTRDPIDVIGRDYKLPRIGRGDWLYFENMGAYTISLATRRHESDLYRMVYFFRVDEQRTSSGENRKQ